MNPDKIKSLQDVATIPAAIGIVDQNKAVLFHIVPLVDNGVTYDIPVMSMSCNRSNMRHLIKMLDKTHTPSHCTLMKVDFNDEFGDVDPIQTPTEITLWVKRS